jgi:hypothetical protein
MKATIDSPRSSATLGTRLGPIDQTFCLASAPCAEEVYIPNLSSSDSSVLHRLTRFTEKGGERTSAAEEVGKSLVAADESTAVFFSSR